MGCLARWNIAFQRSARRTLREPVELRQAPAVAPHNAARQADPSVSLTDYADVWATGGGFVFSSVGVVPAGALEAARRRPANSVAGESPNPSPAFKP
jgi:hypothetical protein